MYKWILTEKYDFAFVEPSKTVRKVEKVPNFENAFELSKRNEWEISIIQS